jgi:hypothetical protein
MTVETTITASEAAELAHTYALYREAVSTGNNTAITVYGDWLLRWQRRLGVEVCNPITIKVAIIRAEERLFDGDDHD